LSFLKYIAITAVTAAVLSVLIHGGAFGKQCTFYEDGSNSCNKKINKNQWDCNTMGNKICGNNNNNNNDNHKKHTSQNFQDFKEDLNIIEANEATNHPTPINQNIFIVCNMWKVCQELYTDNYMSSYIMKDLCYNFDNDLYTFSIKDITN
jgi:hypothetical protein